MHTSHRHIRPCRTEFLFRVDIFKSYILGLPFGVTNNWKDFLQNNSGSIPLVFPSHLRISDAGPWRTYSFVTILWPSFMRHNTVGEWSISGSHSYTGSIGNNLTTHGSDYEPQKYIPLNPNYPQLNFPFNCIQKCP